MEVTPAKPKTNDIFLHLIQVGDKNTLQTMVQSTPVKTQDRVGVRFEYENKHYEVMFDTKAEAGGTISIRKKGQKILEEPFTQNVKPQEGMY